MKYTIQDIMKTTLLILFAITTLGFSEVVKLDSIAINGETYTKATIEKVNSGQAKIMHSDGVKRVPLANLPKDLQDKLGFDPATLEREKEALRKQIEKQKELKDSKIEMFYVDQVLPTGIVVSYSIVTGGSIIYPRGSRQSIGGGGNSTPKKRTKEEQREYDRKNPFPMGMKRIGKQAFIPFDKLPKEKIFMDTTLLKVRVKQDGSIQMKQGPMRKLKVVKFIAVQS